MDMPEKIYLQNQGDFIVWCEEYAKKDGDVLYIRQDVFNPDWDQAEAARESLQEHMLITKKALEAVLALSRAYSDWPMNVSDEDEIKINGLISTTEGTSHP